ncbi:pentapeptide repeat-containing protein [bacterium]|nr:pentapeptide repeat-containing protein [bacterium]
MKKPTLITLLLFVLTSFSAFSQGQRVDVVTDAMSWTGKLIINGETYEIKQNANLDNANLSGADLTHANLGGASLVGANLSNANLKFASLGNTDLRNANLSGAKGYSVGLNNANLSGANLDRYQSSFAVRANENTILPNGWKIVRNQFMVGPRANLGGMNLWNWNADLSGLDLSNTIARQGADFTGNDFTGTDFSGADLRNVKFKDCDLTDVNFTGANLGNADLSGTIMKGANLTGANLSGANTDGAWGLNLTTNEQQVADLVEQLAQANSTIEELKNANAANGETQDGRANVVNIEADPETGSVTVSLNFEESEDLKSWQKVGETITKTIQLKEGKKFYRFGLGQ